MRYFVNVRVLSSTHHGQLIEAGIDTLTGTGMALTAGDDKTHHCNLVVGIDGTSDVDIGKSFEPSRRNRRSIEIAHEALREGSAVETVGVGNTHDIRHLLVSGYTVAAADGVLRNIKLMVSADYLTTLAFLNLLADTLAHNLHIDAGAGEEHVLILGNVGRFIVIIELCLADHFDGLDFEQHRGAIVGRHQAAFFYECIDGLVFGLQHIGVSHIVFAGCKGCTKSHEGGNEEEEIFLHVKVKCIDAHDTQNGAKSIYSVAKLQLFSELTAINGVFCKIY